MCIIYKLCNTVGTQSGKTITDMHRISRFSIFLFVAHGCVCVFTWQRNAKLNYMGLHVHKRAFRAIYLYVCFE